MPKRRHTDTAARTDKRIEYMNRTLNFKLAVNNHLETFGVKTGGDSLVISPNARALTALFFNYRLISFSVAYAPRFVESNRDDSLRGKTKNFTLGLGFNAGKFYTDLAYKRTRGYYLENTADYVPGYTPGDPYIQFPQLVFTSVEGQTMYKFNRRFSQMALTSQTQRQTRSAGSFMPKLYYRFFTTADGASATAQKTRNLQVILGAGYHHTFVAFKSLYLSMGLTPAYGLIYTRLFTPAAGGLVQKDNASGVLQLDAMLGAGYNGRRVFFGFRTSSVSLSYTQQGTTAINSDNRLYNQVFLGYRFNAPKALRTAYDEVLNTLREDKRIRRYLRD